MGQKQDVGVTAKNSAVHVPMDTSGEVAEKTKKSSGRLTAYNLFMRDVLNKDTGHPDILRLKNKHRMKAAAKKWREGMTFQNGKFIERT